MTTQLPTLLLLALTVTLAAQEAAEVRAVDKERNALLEQFHRVMPPEPALLRQAAVRRAIAPKAVPVLAKLREFLRDHKDAGLGSRGLEFTIYALVLDDATVHEPLQQLATANDATAKLLLDCASAIQASDAMQRAAAVAAVGAALAVPIGKAADQPADRPTEPRADQPAAPPTDPSVPTESTMSPRQVAARCAVQCLLVAGDLSVAEAQQLAAQATDPELTEWLAAAAELAAKDPKQLLGKPLELKGTLHSGEAFSTSSLRGKVVLVDFWATWCQPCVRSLPDLVAAKHKYAAQGLVVLGISSDREPESLAKFLAARPEIDWPQLFEPGTDGWHPLAVRLGITSIPRLFLIDKKGVLRNVDAHDKLDALLVALLAE